MADSWSKGLRGNQTTPRQKALTPNNRYASKGADEDVVERERTPKQAAGLPAASRATPRGRGGAKPPLPRQNSSGSGSTHNAGSAGTDDADTASVAESDDVSVMTEDDYRDASEGDSVQVFVRVRPTNSTEAADGEQYNCTKIFGDRTVCVELKHRPEPYQFKFDAVLPEGTSQTEIFERAGKPIVDNCMAGYNSSIFAYGQTGAGKTYTMQGPLAAAMLDGSDERGLAPRVFEYLFNEIDRAQDEKCHENLTFCCRCSMLEIYNEVITDLLNPAATNLQIREDIKRGCYVEDLSEQLIQNVSDAMRLMRMGAENRHVGETRLNRESSRSHSVFTCTLERHSRSEETGVTNVLFSRLNLIDLAGSERIHGGEHGGSQATGRHFKEACHINKSLTTLGRVIMELVEAQRCAGAVAAPKGAPGSGGKPGALGGGGGCVAPGRGGGRHVPYRDSRLTFLLQDSLGGNAKTLMIANISPSSVSSAETLSTLQFMSRAKCIRNRATINLDARGDVVLLQREIVRLNTELDNLRKGYTEPAIQEAKELRTKLEEMAASKGQLEVHLLGLEKDNQHLKAERRRLDHKMAQIQKGANTLDSAIFSLTAKVMHHESLAAAAAEKTVAAMAAEHELALAQLRCELSAEAQDGKALAVQLEEAAQQLADACADADAAKAEAAAARTELQQEREARTEQLAQRDAELAAAAAEKQALQQQLCELQDSMAKDAASHKAAAEQLQQQLDAVVEARDEAAEALAVSKDVNAGLDSQLRQLMQQLDETQVLASEQEQQLAASSSELAGARQQLESSAQALAAAQQQLEAQQQEAATQAQEHAAAAGDARQQLQQQLDNKQEQLEALQQQHQEATQTVSELQDQLSALQQQVTELDSGKASASSRSEELQQELAELQQQLEAAAAAAAADKAAAEAGAASLQQQLEAASTDAAQARGEVAALNSAAKDASAALEASQEQCKQLQQQLEAANAAAAARADALASDLAAVREAGKVRQEELMRQVTELHLSLSTAQQEAEQLRDELDGARSDGSLLAAQLADVQAQMDELRGQASSKGLDCEALRKKLAAADAAIAGLKGELADRGDELADVAQQLQLAEASAQEQQQAAAGELNSLKRELMDTQELLASRSFEVQQLQCRMEELMHRLADKNACMDAHKEELKGLKGMVARMEGLSRQREALLADKSALADQLQADNESLHARVRQLQEDLSRSEAQLRCKLNANELQLKEQIVYNARNRQAMNEIRKVINWAQQPPMLAATGATPPGHAPMERTSSSGSGRQQLRGTVLQFGSAGGGADGSRTESPEEMDDVDAGIDVGGAGLALLPGAAGGGGGSSSRRHRHSSSGGGSSFGGQLLAQDEAEFGLHGNGAAVAVQQHRASSSGGGGGGGTRGSSSRRGGGDGLVSVTISSGKGGVGSSSGAKPRQVQRHAGDGSSDSDVPDTQQHGADDSRSDDTRLLAPEQASSPRSLALEESLQPSSSPQRHGHHAKGRRGDASSGGGGTCKQSQRERESRRGGLRAGSEHHSFSLSKRRNVLMSADGSVVLSVSAEWAAGAHQQQQGSGGGSSDMRLPAAIVGGTGADSDA